MEFVIEAVATKSQNKWQIYVRMKNELYSMFALDVKDIKKDIIVEADNQTDVLVGLMTLDLIPEKLYLTGHMKKSEYELMTKNKAKDAEKILKKYYEGVKPNVQEESRV